MKNKNAFLMGGRFFRRNIRSMIPLFLFFVSTTSVANDVGILSKIDLQSSVPTESYSIKEVAQRQRGIKGIVRDQKGDAIIGANVMIKGTQIGVITNITGEFQIQAKGGDVLTFSYLGYKTQEVAIGEDNIINITLQEDAEILDEVVITAFGTCLLYTSPSPRD